MARLPLTLLGGGRWRRRLSRARARLCTREPTEKGRQFLLPAPGRRGPNSHPSHRRLDPAASMQGRDVGRLDKIYFLHPKKIQF